MSKEKEIKVVKEPFVTGHAKKIEYVEENGCHVCVSHARVRGYPRVYRNGKIRPMHRYIYELYNGKIPDGLVVRHKCDNPACINPEHLELGTQADNMRDKVERGRASGGITKGEEHWHSKLTEDDVREIVRLLKAGKSYAEIARQFSITRMNVYFIKHGHTWTHITGGAIS